RVSLAFALAACAPGRSADESDAMTTLSAGADTAVAADVRAAETRVLPGLEVLLRDSAHLVRGRRVGFLTNQTAVTSRGESGIDLLHAAPDVQLVALYGPEH